MIHYRNISFLLLLLIIQQFIHAQKHEVYQISGQIRSSDSTLPISFAHIKTMNNKRIHVSDWFGQYTIVIRTNETLMFSSMGYKSQTIHIADTFENNRLILDIYLQADTISLAETEIYDLPTYKQFIEIVAKIEVPDDDYQRAMRNLSPEVLRLYFDKMEMDYSMNYRHFVQSHVDQLYYKGQMRPIPLFNVFNWAKFIKALQNGDFKKK